MNISTLNLVYFSATGTTKKVLEHISNGIGIEPAKKIGIIKGQKEDITFKKDDLVIFGAPVYAGRIPSITIESFNKFKGDSTPAIITCVYGNRDYDDALLELKNVVESNNFKVISAGAFVAEHSIFPSVGKKRPDDIDTNLITDFGKKSMAFLRQMETSILSEIKVKGNNPYKTPGAIPLKPKGDKKCNYCGLCVKQCPVNAIDINNPKRTDKNTCISCAHCISICPQKSRKFGGLIYKIASKKFQSAYGNIRKEPEVFFAE